MDLCQYRLIQTTGPLEEYCWIIALMVLGGGVIAHSTQKLNMPHEHACRL